MKPYLAYKASNVEWLGMVPKHWEVKPTKNIFFFINRGTAPTYTEEENKTMVVNQATFSQGKWNINKIRYTTECFDSSRGALIPKDILIASTGGGVLGKVFYFEEENGKYIADSHVTILRTNPKNAHSKFYSYIFSILYDYINAVLAFGSTNQTELQRERLKSHKLPSPPLPEQQAIVDYLDRETAEMDALITEQEELVSLLKQKRSAIISEAVCRGLDPTVPMKDSGGEWLGMVPNHWIIKRSKNIFFFINRGTAPIYTEEENKTMVVNQATFSQGKWDTSKIRYTTECFDSSRGALTPKDILIASTGGGVLGKVFYFEEENGKYIADSHVTILRSNTEIVNPKFYSYIFSILYDYINAILALGSTNQTELQRDRVKCHKLPVPPLLEQHTIVDYLDQETAEIDHLIADCETSIQLLKQRRTALISEAVTGKIDVRTA